MGSVLQRSLLHSPSDLRRAGERERRRGNEHTALPLLLTAPTEPHKMGRPDSWWVERKILVRKALSGGLYPQAYQIAAGSGLADGVDFAAARTT